MCTVQHRLFVYGGWGPWPIVSYRGMVIVGQRYQYCPAPLGSLRSSPLYFSTLLRLIHIMLCYPPPIPPPCSLLAGRVLLHRLCRSLISLSECPPSNLRVAHHCHPHLNHLNWPMQCNCQMNKDIQGHGYALSYREALKKYGIIYEIFSSSNSRPPRPPSPPPFWEA